MSSVVCPAACLLGLARTVAGERLHEEIGADYTDMIYAATPEDIATRRKAFIDERA
jgi:hypothetical protein